MQDALVTLHEQGRLISVSTTQPFSPDYAYVVTLQLTEVTTSYSKTILCD